MGEPAAPRGPKSWPVYALLAALSWLACLFPAAIVYGLAGRVLAGAIFAVTLWREPRLNRRQRGAQRNMRIAFPSLSPRALRRLTWRYALHVAWLLLETLRLPLLTRRRLSRRVDGRAFETVRAALGEGRGVIGASGHFGNWEALNHIVGLEALPLAAVARPCGEAGLERWLQSTRRRYGQRVISKFGGLWPLKKALQRGEAIGLNVDENTRKGGVFVPFAGTLAATNTSAALLQRRSRAPILVLTCNRAAPEHYRVHVWRVIRPDPTAARDAERRRVTAEIAAGFAEALRAYPEQWLWSLRRWETRPQGEDMGADGLPPRASAG